MALKKTEKADIKRRYPLYVEIGMVMTLAVLIVAFRLDMSVDDSFDVQLEEQEVVQMEEIQQTQQIEKPPPPPRPPVPVEVPNDEVLDDVELDLDVSLPSSVDRIILDQVGGRFARAHIIHMHNFEGRIFPGVLEAETSDATKSVDCTLDHDCL